MVCSGNATDAVVSGLADITDARCPPLLCRAATKRRGGLSRATMTPRFVILELLVQAGESAASLDFVWAGVRIAFLIQRFPRTGLTCHINKDDLEQ